VLREAIAAAVTAHGAGKILPKEMPFKKEQGQRTDLIRVAPGYSSGSVTGSVILPKTAYTVDGLAKFLGFVKATSDTPTNSFIAAFGAEELIDDGVLKESQIKGLSAERLGELVISVRKQRDAAYPTLRHATLQTRSAMASANYFLLPNPGRPPTL
jgi:hypothetical protein